MDNTFPINIYYIKHMDIRSYILILLSSVFIIWCALNLNGYLEFILYFIYMVLLVSELLAIRNRFVFGRHMRLSITDDNMIYKAPKFEAKYLLKELKINGVDKKNGDVVLIILKSVYGPKIKIKGYERMNDLYKLLKSKGL